ncbi:solute carrier family 35 member E2B-like [Panonychus citri]|uniref:solute carrier family 35 member E2B-like n=1 Tax=Panonychus citri TaxID=50023 RepID=UPI002307D30B|nr:solute carrier family 35 member E2B-like [Panonychus citri]
MLPHKSNFMIKYDSKLIYIIAVWYFFSFTTLFLNKYILSYLNGDPTILGSLQLFLCSICGYIHLKYPIGYLTTSSKKIHDEIQKPVLWKNFNKSLLLIGCLRYSTIVLGLYALWYVPVSFAETVKSSAPVFTVIISWALIGETTTTFTKLSLIPVMSGLAICSAYELSFTFVGLIVSLATNLSECLQNVYSKKMLRSYEPAEMQFYSSTSSLLLQIPFTLFMVDFGQVWEALMEDSNLFLSFLLAGISFHLQSLSEYLLLTFISPVTHSVANTAKRALLIWLSVIVFGNPVTYLSWLGTATVILGVLLYNKARSYDGKSLNLVDKSVNLSHII